ncbi:MAG: GAF domain-containing protein [Anaerolineae bacterium]|jgi:PAS domain S-box-containing protein
MSKAKILIVEDESIIALDIKDQMLRHGYEVVGAVGTGEEAIRVAEGTQPDLVLMDVRLGGPIDGLEAARQLHQRFGTPVVYITAFADEETLQRATQTAPFGYITKPVDGRELRLTVEVALHKHRLDLQLRESEEKYRSLVEQASDGIAIIQDGAVRFANQTLADMWGSPVDSVLGTPFTDFVHPDHVGELLERYTRRMAGEDVTPVYETVLKRSDGSDFHAELNAGLNSYQGRRAVLAIVRDITERKELEQELKERRLYLEGVLSAAPDAVVTLDTEHRIVDWNPGAERLFGYSPDEALGRDLDQLVADPDPSVYAQARAFTLKSLNGQPVPPTASVRYRKDGTAVDVMLAGAPIQVEDELVGLVAVYTDISERMQAEAALRASETRLSGILSSMVDSVFSFDAEGRFTFCSVRDSDDLHTLQGEFIGKKHSEVMPPNVDALFVEALERSKGGESADYEYPLAMDGEEKWFSAKLSPRFVNGEFAGAVAVVRNITERKRAREAVRESEAKYRALFESANDAIFLMKGIRFVDCNSKALTMYGYERDEIVGRTPCELSLRQQSDESDAVEKARYRVDLAHSGEPQFFEWNHRRHDGTLFNAEVSLSAIVLGAESYVQAIVRDITERRQAEEAQRRHTTQLEALQEVGLEVASELNLDELLRSIVMRAVQLVDASAGGFDLYRPEQEELDFEIHTGYETLPRNTALQLGEGFGGMVWKTGKSIIVDDYAAWDGRAAAWVDHLGHAAGMGVPVQWGDEFLGVLEVTADPPRAFSKADAELLEVFATQAAIAIENARLYEETQRRATQAALLYEVGQQLSGELELGALLSTTVRAVHETFDYHNVALMLLDEDAERLTMQSVAGAFADILPQDVTLVLGEGMIGHAAATHQTQLSNDVSTDPHYVRKASEATKSELAVPIKSGDRVIGVLDVQDDDLDAFDDLDVTTLETLSSQIGTAIENARLFEAERRRSAQLATVSQVAESITSILDLEEVLERTVELISAAFGYYHVAIMLIDEQARELTFGAHTGGHSRRMPSDFRQPLDEGMMGWSASRGDTLLANDVGIEPRFVAGYLPETRSELDVPLRYRGRVIGVLDLQSQELNAFDEHDVMAMEALAGHVAAAIENARLYERARHEIVERKRAQAALRHRAEELAALQDTVLDITSQHDLPTLLETIVRRAASLLGAPSGGLYLCDPAQRQAHCVVSYNTPDDYTGTVLEYGEGAAGTVAQTGEPLIIDDYRTWDGRATVFDEDRPFTAVLSAPMVWREEVIGVIHVLDRAEERRFTEASLDLLSLFANHAAIAVENARLLEVAERRVTELRAVRQASLKVTSTLELEPVLETILESAMELAAAGDAHVFLYDGDHLDFGAALWNGQHQQEPLDFVRPHGLTYTVARSGERVVVSDASTDPIFADRRWEGAIVGLPLTVGTEVHGVMNVAYARPHRFSEDELRVLDLLADQAALAIRNARLYKETRERALEQETLREAASSLSSALDRDEVVESILAQLQRVVPYDTASVLLLRDNALDIVGGRGFPESSEILSLSFSLDEDNPNGEVIRSREPLILEDATQVSSTFQRPPHGQTGVRAWLGVPMLVGDQLVGMIALDKQEPGFYAEAHAQLAKAFAAQAAVAIENARLFAAEKEQRDLSERLRETALLLNRSLDLQKVLEMILEQLARVIDYDSGSIQILEDDATKIIATRNLPESQLGHRYPLAYHPYNRYLVEDAQPIVIDDVADSSNGWLQSKGLEHVRANVGVPLQVRDHVIGILTVDSRHPAAYTEDDARLIQTFAQQAAVAIENARLFEEERRQRQLSEALEEAAAAVGSTLELEEVLDRILEQVAHVIDGDAFNVMLVEDDHAHVSRRRGYEASGARELVNLDLHIPDVPYLSHMADTGDPMVIEDTAALEGQAAVEARRWVRSCVCAPIQVSGATVGFLNVDGSQPGQFSVQDGRWLAAFADHASAAIENARLYREAQKRALEQKTLRKAALAMTTALERDEVIEGILAQLQEVVPYDTASVQLLQDSRLELVGGRGFPNLEALLGVSFDCTSQGNPNRDVVRTRRPLILEDAPKLYEEFRREPHAQAGIRSWLGVPMLVGDRLIGMIALDKREPGFYRQEHARLAETFAAQAAVAVENAQLHQETVRQLAQTEVLREMMFGAASTFDFDEVLERTISVLRDAIGVEYLSFAVPDDSETHMVSHHSLLGFAAPEEGYCFSIDACLTGQVYRTGEPAVLADVRKAQVYAAADESVLSEMAVPVWIGDRVAAVLNLESPHLDAFDEDDLAFYTAVAGQLGLAMENAKLFEAERKQRQLAEALEEAAAAVGSTLELEQVLDRILEQVERVVSGDTFNIMLIQGKQARVVRWRGYEKVGVADRIGTYSIQYADYATLSEMSRTGKSVVVTETAEDNTWVRQEAWDWLQSYVAAPIRVGGTTVGFLNVDSMNPGQFTIDDARRLETFASHAATAIENARLYQSLREHAETLGERVAERTAQLQAQYARLEAILKSTVNGIVVAGPDGELVLANPIAQEWLTQSLSPQEADLLRRTLQDLASRAEENPEEVLELTGVDLQLKAAKIVESGLRGGTSVVAIHDISHLKALDRMKSRFVSNVSHELRTPIATIKLFAHLMRKQPENWEEYLEPLAQEADHQADLVEDILEISRVDAGRLEIRQEQTNLNHLVEIAVVNHAARAQKMGLSLEHRMAESGPVCAADPQRLMQVLDNLIDNAVRYTPRGGTITVSTGQREAQGRPWGTMTIADTGMGIPEDELPHVFERFFRGEKPRMMQISGTGLGLAIVKEIAGLHGGQVTVESQVDEGSAFTVWVPLAH